MQRLQRRRRASEGSGADARPDSAFPARSDACIDAENWRLGYLLASQAQKHVTVNEALRLLDGLVQLAVLDRDLTVPPGAPADGDRYIVASGATGAWLGWDGSVGYWVDGGWMQLVPRVGWRAWIEDEDVLLVFDGSA